MPTGNTCRTTLEQPDRHILDRIIDHTPFALSVYDREGRYQRGNRAYRDMFGSVPPPEYSLFEDPILAGHGMREKLLEVRDGRAVSFSTEVWYNPSHVDPRLPGRDVCARGAAFPILDRDGKVQNIVVVHEDVTEYKRVERALRASEMKYRTLFEASSDAVLLKTLDGRILDCNTSACQMLGYTKDELVGLRVENIVDERTAAALPAVTREQVQTGGAFVEAAGRRKDGEVFPTEVSTRLVTIDGEHLVIAFVRDISERRRAVEEQQRLQTRIQHGQKLESLGVLAGGVAHEFNNLLTGIVGNADLALMNVSATSPARDNILGIETSAKRAADLCKQMLAYSGKGRFVVRPLDLNEAVREMTRLLEVSVSKGVVIEQDLMPELPTIEGDATQLRQVILNLVTNASEAIGRREGTVRIRTGAIPCRQEDLVDTFLDEHLPEGTYVYVEVSDTGCGMKEEMVGRIFDPFFTTKFAGRGLGLAAVLGIVRSHRGTVQVTSEVGRGTTFRVLLPAVRRGARVGARGSALAGEWRGRGSVLVIDDEETVREITQRMVEKFGFKGLSAASGAEGVEVFRRQADEIVAVVLDLTMPHKGGEETFRELRAIRDDARVILSSGYSESDLVRRLEGCGIAGFIQKPYQAATLVAKIREAIES